MKNFLDSQNLIHRRKISSPAPESFEYQIKTGFSRRVVEEISWQKSEPDWMRKKRIRAYEIFCAKPYPQWGVDLTGLNLNQINFYQRFGRTKYKSWKAVPKEIKNKFEELGIPKAERAALAGVIGQYDSEALYQKTKTLWESKGVIFCDTDTAVQKYPELLKNYFMTRCVPPADNKFAALHGAVWSGGSFLYVPPNTKVTLPVQTYFRMNAKSSGQFEHTLIIVEEGASVHYMEGCTAPIYNTNSLHSAVVEIFVKAGGHCRYTTVQNWSKDVYNLNTKRALVEEEGAQEWIGGSLGSKKTMLYPASFLLGRGARANHLNIALAGPGQHKDTGAKIIHGAPNTSSNVVSKSISYGGGISTYRGLIKIVKGASGSKAHVQCDALMPDNKSMAKSLPNIQVFEKDVSLGHEARIGQISKDQIFYLQSRGFTEEQAIHLIIQGFIEPVTKELPLAYSLELNRIIQLEISKSLA